MKKTNPLCLALLLTFFCSVAYGEQRAYPTLTLLDSYEAPAFPARPGGSVRESYDSRVKHGTAVPDTFIDTFICDLWTILSQRLEVRGLSKSKISAEKITLALEFYTSRDWTQIPGYRPWTHWNFIRSLTSLQQQQLAKEASEYISAYGVRDIVK